jgi:putative ABC transport system permease protein
VTALATRDSDAVLDLAPVRGSIGALSPASIAVSTSAADEHRWIIGSTVALVFPDGASETMTVGALYRHTDLVADYVMPLAAWAPHAGQAIDTQLLVRLRPGVDPNGMIGTLDAVAAPFGNPRVQTLAQYRASATSGVNTFLGLIDVMLALAIVIALMGIANTLSLSIHERTRELGVLRAVGQTRAQLRAMVRWESLMIAVFGTALGIAVGAFAGWGIVRAADSASLSVFSLPVTQLLVFLVVGAIAGTLAGLRPARRAARIDVLAVLAVE